MKPQSKPSGYTPIPGSDAVPRDPSLAELESGDRAKLAAREVRGLSLGRVVMRGQTLPVVLDVLDRLALDQEPEELTVYLHLYRLAVANERNFCRVSRAELERRTRMSQLRLGKALAGLVSKGHVALVDRNREGTLYRVALPHEVRGEAEGAAQVVKAKPPTTPPSPVHGSAPTRSAPVAPIASAAALVARFCADHGGKGRSPEQVLDEVISLIEDGYALEQIEAALVRFAKELPRKTPIAELPRLLRS